METMTLAAVTAIIPTLDEAASIGPIVEGLLGRGVGRVIVADGGSSDATASLARAAGATVVVQRERGYGSACLAGVAAAGAAPVLLFLDGDGAEDLNGAVRVAETLLRGEADLVLGKRIVAPGEAGAQTLLARYGNGFCSWWLRLVFNARVTDFASMKAIGCDTYERLHPEHRRYGWTAQLIARAARHRLSIVEVPVRYRRRGGSSKVSGTVSGAAEAGRQMLAVVAAESFRPLLHRIHASLPVLSEARAAEHVRSDGGN